MSVEIKDFPTKKYQDTIKKIQEKLLKAKRKQLEAEKLLTEKDLSDDKRIELKTVIEDQSKVLVEIKNKYRYGKEFIHHEIHRHLEFLDPENNILELNKAAMIEDLEQYLKFRNARSRREEAVFLESPKEIGELDAECLDYEYGHFGFVSASKDSAMSRLMDFKDKVLTDTESFEKEYFNLPTIESLFNSLKETLSKETVLIEEKAKKKIKVKP